LRDGCCDDVNIASFAPESRQGDTVFAGKRPSNLGVTDGRLAAPKRSPNCVSSQTDPADTGHYIAPIEFSGSPLDAIAALRKIVEGAERTLVVKHEPNYLYAEFKSKLLGFVDDVEFFAAEKEGVIHVRSASRLGRRDFGVNRARVESIREQFAAAQRTPAKA
jgi:uncharacterized protein (DUF1499 family)